MTRFGPGLLVTALLLGQATGCASNSEPVSVSSWQQSVEHYVWDQGNGDPNVLRDMSWDDVHKGFAVMSEAQPAQSNDAIGLLLGHPRVGDAPCFVFLVALVSHQQLESLQPVALRVQGGKFDWIIGRSSRPALDAYRRWEAQKPSDDSAGSGGPPFPRAGDSFRVDVVNDELFITHQPTGISWSLTTPATARAVRPARTTAGPASEDRPLTPQPESWSAAPDESGAAPGLCTGEARPAANIDAP